jgi:putative chitinase
MTITEEQLKKIFIHSKGTNLRAYLEQFNKILPEYKFITPKRIAAFLGQVGVESAELNITTELPSKYNKHDPLDKSEPTGTLYEGRKATLGNYVVGDGPRFIGRGIIQLTGRSNYTRMGAKLNVDLIKNPELAAKPELATRIACQYWIDHNLHSHADAWNITRITELVNGSAKLGAKERTALSELALKVLTVEEVNA